MSFLETIIAHKYEEVATKKRSVPQTHFEEVPEFHRQTLSLAQSLRNKTIAIIAEIKKASPSRNIIRQDFEPAVIAQEYALAGACAVSVLTDEKFFLGKLEFMEQIRRAVAVPILRKDFIIDSYQLYEAKAYGADAILLIAAVLDSQELIALSEEAASLGLQSIVEIHSEEEIESLDLSSIEMVGLNNRDLKTFETDLYTSVRLKKYIPSDKICVSESGISSGEDIDLLMSHGIHAFLIGESLMRADNPGTMLAGLLKSAEADRGEN